MSATDDPQANGVTDTHGQELAKGREPEPGTGEIVVGVDGSERSRAALLWAADQAGLTGARLHVVGAWSLDVGTTAWGIPEMPPPDYNPEQATRLATEAFLAEVLGAASADITLSVIGGPAGPVLTDAARHADLLVLGSHGHSAIRDLLLGSTTEYCIHHATCPVLVLRTDET